MPELNSARFWLAVSGTIRPDISEDLVSASLDDGLDRLRIILNNVRDGAYAYSDGTLLKVGSRIELSVGPDGSTARTIFGGEIAAIAPSFTSDKPSTILVEAVGAPVRKRIRLSISLGKELYEFRPVLSEKAGVECSGTIEGNPDLRCGSTITVSGTGRIFDLTYFVTRTIHVFDSKAGYRTHFVASTRKPQSNSPDIDL